MDKLKFYFIGLIKYQIDRNLEIQVFIWFFRTLSEPINKLETSENFLQLVFKFKKRNKICFLWITMCFAYVYKY